jgi:hypothetical protein
LNSVSNIVSVYASFVLDDMFYRLWWLLTPLDAAAAADATHSSSSGDGSSRRKNGRANRETTTLKDDTVGIVRTNERITTALHMAIGCWQERDAINWFPPRPPAPFLVHTS